MNMAELSEVRGRAWEDVDVGPAHNLQSSRSSRLIASEIALIMPWE